jgi:hypothetical protein
MPPHAQPPAAYVVVVEYEDGSVGTSLVVDSAGAPALTPSHEDLRLAAWLVAHSLADEDKDRIHDVGSGGSADQPDPCDGIGFRIADDPEDDGDDVYVQPMGRVRVS